VNQRGWNGAKLRVGPGGGDEGGCLLRPNSIGWRRLIPVPFTFAVSDLLPHAMISTDTFWKTVMPGSGGLGGLVACSDCLPAA